MHFPLCGLLRPTAAHWRYQDPQTRAKSLFCTFYRSCTYSSLLLFSLVLFSITQNIIFLFTWMFLLSFPFNPTPPPPLPARELPLQAFVHASQTAQCWHTTHKHICCYGQKFTHTSIYRCTWTQKCTPNQEPTEKKRFVYVPCSCFMWVCVLLLFFYLEHSSCLVHLWDSTSNLSVPSCFSLFGRDSLSWYQIGLL